MGHKIRLPSQRELLEWFSYDPATGHLCWRKTRPNCTPVGTPITYRIPPEDGYIRVMFFGIGYYAHCVIWKMLYNEEPEEIDHKSGVKYDNRLDNLQPSYRSHNMRKSRIRKDNTSGHKNISRYADGRWRVHVRSHHVGYFRTVEEAIIARDAFIKEYDNRPALPWEERDAA